MSASRPRALALALLLACTPPPAGDGTDTSTSTSTTTSTTSTSTTVTTELPTTGATTFVFPDLGALVECDIWEETCPEGQKCMPASLDGDSSWESTICVPIVPDPAQLDEPCIAGPIATGQDTCDKHLMCWHTNDAGEGTCIAMCSGSIDAPFCEPPDTICHASPLVLCLFACDALAQNCPAGLACIPNPEGEGFVCVIDASGDEGQAFDPCEYANVCDPGLTCNDPAFALECDQNALGCCLPFCDLTKPNTCPGKNQVCTFWYAEGQAPPGYENVGLCTLPQ